MIICALALITISLIVIFLCSRKSENIWLIGIFSGFILINLGMMFYYAKMGGLSTYEELLFFIFPPIMHSFKNAVISLNSIAFIAVLGYNAFLYFVLMFALDIRGFARRLWIFLVCAIWPVINILLSNTNVIATQKRNYFSFVSTSTTACMFVYLFIAMFCLLYEYFSHTIRWIKRQLRYIILFVLNLMIYFLMFCQINPIYIVTQYYSPKFGFGFPLQYRLRLSFSMWIVTIIIVVLIFVVGVVSLYKYTKVSLDENKENLYVERQLSTLNMGARVFIHGIKNQLLAEKIILSKLKEQAASSDANVQSGIKELAKINQQMTSHIETLYRSFKLKSIEMTQHTAEEIVLPIIKAYRERYPNIKFCFVKENDSQFMADSNYIAEAIENLFNNAIDAIHVKWGKDIGGMVTVLTKVDPRWCAIRVDDNGIGMSKEKMKKIFKPFFTDKSTTTNWGIGLSSVQQTVKLHFGHIYAESRFEEGSTFIIALPKIKPSYFAKKNKNVD